jgi:hypothetical protein
MIALEGIANLINGQGRHNLGLLTYLLQGIFHGQSVHHRGQHTHVIASDPIQATLGQTGPAKYVTSADYQGDLHPRLSQLFYIVGNTGNHFRIYAKIAVPHQGFATEFQ